MKKKVANRLRNVLRIDTILSNQNKIIQLQQKNESLILLQQVIADSEWLKQKSFISGGWAVDSSFLLTLYFTLSYMKPKSIIEFGLGQSSKMVHQYASFYNIDAVTCEHDNEWNDFFLRNITGYKINTILLPIMDINYKGYTTTKYDLSSLNPLKKYDLVIIDGPFGSEHHSRIQALEIIKNNLNSTFCILLDDYERIGERETANEIRQELKSRNIDFIERSFFCEKEHLILCTRNLKFLISLHD